MLPLLRAGRSGLSLTLAVGCGLAAAGSLAVPARAEVALQRAWARQLGTSAEDWTFGTALDGLGNIYVTGRTYGSLGGANAGDRDPFLAKYSTSGTLQWTRQFGTSADDRGYSVAADPLGHVFVGGFTYGSMAGPNAGGIDLFVGGYNAGGTQQWMQQRGTAAEDRLWGMNADGNGNAYFTGRTAGALGGTNAGSSDVIVGKVNAAGNLLWLKQTGTSGDDRAYGVANAPAGGTYIAGYTSGSLGGTNAGGQDLFINRWDADGNVLWTRQFGTGGDDVAQAAWSDTTGVYAAGRTAGTVNGRPVQGTADGLLVRYDADGNLLWARSFGGASAEDVWGVAGDGKGHLFVGGYAADGPFISVFDTDGNLLTTATIGATTNDQLWALTADADAVYAAGYTTGSMDGANAGGPDAFLVKYTLSVPEPASLGLLALGGALLLRRRRA